MRYKPEAYVKQRIRELFDKYGVWYFMPRGTAFGRSGIPDFIACVNGRFFGIEAKANINCRPTAMQLKHMRDINERGGIAFVVHIGNLDELDNALKSAVNDSGF